MVIDTTPFHFTKTPCYYPGKNKEEKKRKENKNKIEINKQEKANKQTNKHTNNQTNKHTQKNGKMLNAKFGTMSWVFTDKLKNCTGCPRMFYTQKCKILRIFITIKTIEFSILIYLSDRAVLLAFWRILNQGNRPNKTENTSHYVKRVIFCITNWSVKRRFYELFSLTHGMLFLFIFGCVSCLFRVKTNLKSYKWLKLYVWDSI